MGTPLAINAKIYRNTGTVEAPTWTAVPEFENVTVTPRYQEGASNSRDSQFSRAVPTLVDVSVTARLKVVFANTNYDALMDAFALASPIELLILDGSNTTVGARGIRADFHVFGATDDQSIANRLYRDLELKPADSANPPQWCKVAAGPDLQFAVPGGTFS